METCERHLKRGQSKLSKHNPEEALKDFQTALACCPPKESANLSKILFYLGFTLKKLGIPNGAVKSWVVAQKLHKSGHATKMIKRFINEYGMSKQKTCHEDDWKAFYAVQLANYMRLKNENCITNPAELDVVSEIISDTWENLCAEKQFGIMEIDDKLDSFRKVKIIFPTMNQEQQSTSGVCIAVDFISQRRVKHDNRCICGSGLPYGKCCGRTLGADELHLGTK
jgi:hypothetical protein